MSFVRFKNVMDYIDFGKTTEKKTTSFMSDVNFVHKLTLKEKK